MYCANFDEVFHATAAGSAQYGVVGVENSVEGVVTRSLDLFLHTPLPCGGRSQPAGACATTCCASPIRSRHRSRAGPSQALAQCQSWLSKHLPHAERRPVSSNAEGARLAATNPAWAGIASERAASQFGLHIVSHAIQDDAYNRTRFAVICLPHTLPTPPASGKDCTSLVISCPTSPARYTTCWCR